MDCLKDRRNQDRGRSHLDKLSRQLSLSQANAALKWLEELADRRDVRQVELPKKLEAELDLARHGGGRGDDAGSGGNTRRGDGNHVGRDEIGVIEEIEKFGTELQAKFFADVRVFQEREIPVWPSRGQSR